MATVTTKSHIQDFLAPFRGDMEMQKLGMSLIKTAKRDPEIAKLFVAVQKAVGSGRPLLTAQQSKRLDQSSSGLDLDVPTAPGWVREGLVAAYLRARANCTAKVADTILEDPGRALRRALTATRRMEPDFVGEYLIETARLAKQSSSFARNLETAAPEYRALVDKLYKAVPPSEIAKAANNGDGACELCRQNTNDCVPISCWVVVVVIIVIVVTK